MSIKIIDKFLYSKTIIKLAYLSLIYILIIYTPIILSFPFNSLFNFSFFIKNIETSISTNFLLWIVTTLTSSLLIWSSFIYLIEVVFDVNLRYKSKTKTVNKPMISFMEKVFINPLFMIINIYTSDECSEIMNYVDIYFIIMIAIFFFTQISLLDRYLHRITLHHSSEVKREKYIIMSLIISNIIFSSIAYIAVSTNDMLKNIITERSLFIVAKAFEVFIIRSQRWRYRRMNIVKREDVIIQNLKNKIYFEVITKFLIVHDFASMIVYNNHVIVNITNFCFVIYQAALSIRRYMKYEKKKSFYRNMMEYFYNEEKSSESECAICKEEVNRSKWKLQCDHSVHLVCLLSSLKRGLKSCPLCSKEISKHIEEYQCNNRSRYYFNLFSNINICFDVSYID